MNDAVDITLLDRIKMMIKMYGGPEKLAYLIEIEWTKCNKLKLSEHGEPFERCRNKFWGPEQDFFLIENYYKLSRKKLARHLDRTVKSLYQRRRILINRGLWVYEGFVKVGESL